MPIVSSVYAIDTHAQAGGGHHVNETHTDHTGQAYSVRYRLSAGQGAAEAQVRLEAHAARLAGQLSEAEAERLVDQETLAFVHATQAQFASAFWSRVRAVRQQMNDAPAGSEQRRYWAERFGFLIWRLHGWVIAGEVTSNQARLSFNTAYGRSLNAAQWNSFVTNTLLPIRNRYQATLDQEDL